MPPNFCPDCGTPVKHADASSCEECGADFEEDQFFDGQDPLDEDFEDSVIDAIESQSTSRTDTIVSGAVAVLAGLVGYLGGFALWLWALALLYEHWGGFWAILGFFTVVFPFVVVVMCFFWGVPHFFLAFMAWLSASFALGNLDRSKKAATLGLLSMLGFGGAAGYGAWNYAHTPRPISARDIDRLTDDAIALISILRATQNENDAEAAVAVTRAKGRLRGEFAEYDLARMDAIEKMVGQYLNFEKSMERDMMAAVEGQIKGQRAVFTTSPGTRAALHAMPERLQAVFSGDIEDIDALSMLFDDRDLDEVPDNWREMMAFVLKKKWKAYGVVYEDVMRRPMPSPSRN